MTIRELLAQLAQLDIKLWLDGERLRFSAPQGAMTPALQAELIKYKPEMIARLKNSANSNGGNLPVIHPVSRSERIPLSFAQQRLWFLDQFEPGSANYNMPSAVRLTGALNEAALKQTINEIVRRHEVLRTHFALQDGAPVQIIANELELPLPITDLMGLPSDEREARVLQLAQAEAETPFDLSRGPLIRVELIGLSSTEHILLFTLHHIISDGWSMGVLIHEVAALYAAYVKNEPSPLPELPIQYADFAHWQREWLSGAVLQQQLDYWTEQLRGSPSLLELPTDRPRPVVQSHHGATHSFEISSAITAGLQAINKHNQTTLFMALAAAFNILLSRYSNQVDICIGTPIANRNRAEIEGLIGFFINTLVLRTQVDGNVSFERLLQQVRASTLAAYAHQDVPFEQLVEVLKLERHTSYSPLFQVMLVLQNTPTGNLELPSLTLQPVSTVSNTAKFDLTLEVAEADEQLFALFEYNTDLFDLATIERMSAHFTCLLEALVANPNRPIQDLPMLSAAEREQILVGWNTTAPLSSPHFPLNFAANGGSEGECIHEMFEQQVQKTPEAVALVYEDQQLTYAELNTKSNQLAHYLRAQGVGPDVLVGICVERSIEMIVGLLGILKAGGAYLPLDPAYPLERLTYMLEDAKPAALLTQQHLQPMLPVAGFCLDSQWDALGSYPQTNPENITLPGNLAYVIYTSGSTGKPKGSLLQHANVARLFSATDAWFGFDEKDTWTLFHSYAFDFSVWEIWGALLYGGKLVIVPYIISRSPDLFHALLVKEKVTILNQTPSAFQQLVEADLRQDASALSLRKVIFGGEALNPVALTPWFDRYGYDQPNLINMYGITETTVHVTYYSLQADTKQISCIGRPIPDLSTYLLDRNLQPVPVGVLGELFVAGDGLARGYLNRPDLTAEKFIPNPFSNVAGARMYKSGDLARYLPDGNIEYLGRIDQQVKIRGFRIELGEIEAALSALVEVREVAVMAREDIVGDKRLVAYLVVQEGYVLSEIAELRSRLSQTLPEYMIPAHFIQIEQLPLTPNGKLDRKVLPAPEMTRSETGYVAPRTPSEEMLAGIWADVLKLDRVGIHDNFFELGGHSLLAIRLIEQMRKAGSLTDVRNLFTAPTIAGLLPMLNKLENEFVVPPNIIPKDCQLITPDMLPLVKLTTDEIAQIVKTVPGGAANIQDIYPLTPLQEGMLFHHLINQAGDAYLMSNLIGFDSRERLESFLSALQFLIKRHDILRTAVCWEGLVEPVQVVWRHAPILIEEVSFNIEDGDIAEQLLARYDPRHTRLDVREAPMLRGIITDDSANHRWLLNILAHHLVDDNTTLKFLVAEIQTVLQGREEDLPTIFPFRNFVAQAQQGISKSGHEAFFREMLAHIDEPTAPFGLLDVQGDGLGIEEARREVDLALAQRLRKQARRLGVSAASVIHLAWAQVLAKTTGHQQVVFGTVLFGRMQGGAGVGRVLGLFINTLPICISVGELSVQDSLLQTHTRLTQLLQHEHASLALAQRCSGVPAPTPLFSALLNYRHSEMATDAELPSNWDGVQMLSTEERTNYPIGLSVDDLGEGFLLTAQVDTSIQAQRICDYMHTTLEHLIAALESAPQTAANQIEVLPAAEREQLLVAWNTTETEYPQGECIHEMFESHAARTPEAVAVVYEDQQLTYAELNTKSNQLAHYLRSQGVGPDVLVGICVERSVEMIVGLLGILKAGGAYLPLDPSYPQERLAYMLEDAKPAALLTQQHLQATLRVAGFCLDSQWDSLGGYPHTNPENVTLPSNLAYVIYTSGSTGMPKGTLLSHSGLRNLIAAQIEIFDVKPASRLLQFVSFGFDVATADIFMALACGASLHLAAQTKLLSAENLLEILASQAITIAQLPVALLAVLPQVPLPSLETLIVGGEVCPAYLVAYWAQNRSFYNAYGPTETTICATTKRCTDRFIAPPIGRPIANTQIYLLDANLQPVPVGVAGELYIGGAGVARGYLNRPELTAEKFIPNPFLTDDRRPLTIDGETSVDSYRPPSTVNSRLYRSGDLARWLPDGNIEYMGRIDQQVKIRGFRIELGEIEAALASLPEVRDVVVLAKDSTLVAYLVPQAGHTLPETVELRSKLAQTLPEYMIPAYFMQLEHLPLTPNGKIDRKALPAPEMTRSETGYVAPRTAAEVILAQIWADVLKLDRVGIHDNFFELGGHSLLAITLMERIQQTFKSQIPLVSLFQNPNLAQFAVLVAEGTTLPWSPIVPIQPRGSCLPLFCVHPAGGLTGVYTELAHHLGADQPFYGIQARGCDMREQPHTSIEEMAACYCEAIQQVQAHGPYLLAGWSMGGLVAYEMAQQLTQLGEQVAFLGLLDSHVSSGGQNIDDIEIIFDFLSQAGQPIDLDKTDAELFPKAFALAQALELVPSNLLLTDFRRYIEVYKTNVHAMSSYQPQPYAGTATLFSCKDDAAHEHTQMSVDSWRGLVGNLAVCDVSGNHATMIFPPHVAHLAAEIAACLAVKEI